MLLRHIPGMGIGGKLLIRFPVLGPFVSRVRRRLREDLDLHSIESSNVFDRDWYLQSYADVRYAGIDPILHYLRYGADEGRDPSPYFKTDRYLWQNPDVRAAGGNPLVHYLKYGSAEGRQQNTYTMAVTAPVVRSIRITAVFRPVKRFVARFLYSSAGYPLRRGWQALKSSLKPLRDWYTDRKGPLGSGFRSGSKDNPRVSVLVVNYNGEHHLEYLFNSLARLTYKNFEIIFIDNASTDASIEYLKSKLEHIKIVQLKDNVGFAEANNIGFELARGEYIFLLNNDTRCDLESLNYLVEALDNDPALGAVGPKIRFWTKFITVEIMIASSASVLLDIDKIQGISPRYQKVFFRKGFSEPFVHDGRKVRRFSGKVKLSVPFESTLNSTSLQFYAEGKSTTVTVRIGAQRSRQVLTAGAWQVFQFTVNENAVLPYWIINNAGSEVTGEGQVSDRGFGSPDDGIYDIADEPTALCGCAMLIRQSALKETEPLFAKNFFAYFEDTDLSLRLRRNGYRLAYCPQSIVYHKHAATGVENSAFFKYYVNRNRILFYALHFPKAFWQKQHDKARRDLNHLKVYYESNLCTQEERDFCRQIDDIFADWDQFLPQIVEGRFYDRTAYFPRIAVFNNYWNSKGGGEYHAAIIAEALQTFGPVDLICEQDFSIEDISQRFGVDLSNCRKFVVTAAALKHNKYLTGQYDIFVNSTYGSDLVSHAKHSLYVVSFPFRLGWRPAGGRAFLDSYQTFLANSNYTKTWCQRFWEVHAETLYPCVSGDGAMSGNEQKSRIILNVGRFFWHGHNKKQRELVQIFSELARAGTLDPEWKLVLAGQVERGQEDYLETVRKAAEGLPVELLPNISREELSNLYRQAAIYWHATGIDEDLDRYPERAEHFGITTLEAMAFGCVPIVIRAGGQPEIVGEGINGYLFSDTDELKRKTLFVANMFDCNLNGAFTVVSGNARVRADEFSKARTQERFLELLTAARSNLEPAQATQLMESRDGDGTKPVRTVA
jgi:GT2 family glycosyltransferase